MSPGDRSVLGAALFDDVAPQLDASVLDQLPTPALVIDLDVVRHNLARMVELLEGDVDRWRPHLKTTKAPRLWSELFAAGVRNFKCATVDEARALLRHARARGESIDLLVAYPHHGPAVGRIADLAREHGDCTVSVLVESVDDVARWPEPIGLFVDLNPGQDRTGLAAGLASRVLEVARAAGARLRGLHYYDGHHAGNEMERQSAAHAGYGELLALTFELRSRGIHVAELVTSGTPSFTAALGFDGFAALESTRHRVSPGTVVLHDARSEEQNPALGFRPAALVATRVVSCPRPGRVTCDAGSKGVSAEAGSPVAVVIGWPRLVPATPSEEHLPLDASSAAPAELPPRGGVLWLVPRHVCTTVNLYDEAVLIEGGRVVGLAAIAARGHSIAGAFDRLLGAEGSPDGGVAPGGERRKRQ
ncbi:D-threonine aldolase [Planctomycetes bacterium Pla163]|uniref:D-threonine aldolase n=1 Tax=Rohdeia mirabilis TaxID=2528008 RepID=A0A518CXA5_9BACT|nr:D-threonine aldolase [Planctomycetes bacterium Pla163]